MPEKTSVLIVDDDVNFCNTLAKILKRKGYATTTAENGQRALELVKERLFDVILMDVKMPVMSGLEAYKEIRQIRPSAVVIFMTAFSIEDLIKDAIKDGAYAAIKKPFDIDTIVNMIEKSKNGALLVIADDDPNMGKTMKSCLEQKGYSTITCLTGEEAVDLAKDRSRDIFFIDMKLPALNGLETYLEIRKVNPAAVVVIMTAYRQEMDELVRQTIEKGAYTCLYKPFDMGEAIKIIEEICNKTGQNCKR
ncbi:MAG: response regulator [Candidatus Omnitrophica bacterium]|nr:response regulator [Candidatus Omnitrophota bacterium]